MARDPRLTPRTRILLAAAIEATFFGLGCVAAIVSGNMLLLVFAIAIGTGIGLPLMLPALRELREQNHASG